MLQKREYILNEKRYAKKENVILLYSEKPFKQAAIISYFIGTLKVKQSKYTLFRCFAVSLNSRPSVETIVKFQIQDFKSNPLLLTFFRKLRRRC